MAKKSTRESMRHRLHRLASNRSMFWLVSTFVLFSALLALLIVTQIQKFGLQQANSANRANNLIQSALKPAINDELARGIPVQDYEYSLIGSLDPSQINVSNNYQITYFSDDELAQFEQTGKVFAQRCKWSSTEEGYKCEGGVLLQVDTTKGNSNGVVGPPPYWKVVKVYDAKPDAQELTAQGFPSQVTNYWQ